MKKIEIMKAAIGSLNDLNKKDYIFEPKLDGVRAICYVNKDIKLFSRNDIDITNKYFKPKFRDNIKAKNAILDGEIISFDKHGRPDFNMLVNGGKALYYIFDILEFDGKSLINKPLEERKKILDEVVQDGNNIEKIIYANNGQALWKEMTKRKWEGVLAKYYYGKYKPGVRSPEWLKVKLFYSVECIIVGYTQKKRILSSLLLALYNEEKKLIYIGKVGTGFTEKFLIELKDKLDKFKTDKAYINIEKPPKSVVWVKPKVVCEVKYVEVSKYGILRTPVFLRLRFDKEPRECTIKGQFK